MAETPSPPRAAWRKKPFFIAGLLLLAGCLTWYAAQWRPSGFVSEAQVLVTARKPAADLGGNALREDYLGTHMTLLRSPIVIERAVTKRDLKNLKSLEGLDAVAEIKSMLVVSRHTDGNAPSSIIDLRYYGPVECDCNMILNAVIDSYEEFLDITYRNVSDQTLELITKARETLNQDMIKAEKQLLQLQNDAINRPRKAQIENRLAALELKAQDAQMLRADVKSQIALLEEAPDSLPVKIQAHEWAAKSGFAFLPDDVKKTTTVMAAYAEHLRWTLAKLDVADASLKQAIDVERQSLREVNQLDSAEINLRKELTRLQQIHDTVVKRLQEIDLVRHTGGFEARVLVPPRTRVARAWEVPARAQ